MRPFLISLIAVAAFAQQQPPTIKATSQEVLLDLVVRDKKGHLVKDLKPNEINVTDDGVAQSIRSLRLRTGAEISTIETTTSTTTTATTTQAQTPRAKPVNPLRDIRVVTFAFDPLPGPNFNNDRTNGSNAGGGDRRLLVKRVAEELLKIDTDANFYWGVFLMGRGRINVVQPYTTDKEKLLAAVAKAVLSPGVVYAEQPDTLGPTQSVAVDPAAAAAGGRGSAPDGVGEAAKAAAELTKAMVEFGLDSERSLRSRDDFFAIEGMVRELQRLPGRKTLVYFTKGIMVLPEYKAGFQNLIAAANRANVTIYCVDPAVASTGFSNAGAGSRILAGAAADSAVNMRKRGGAVTRSEATIIEHAEASITTNTHIATMQLAEDTGGFAIANLSNTEKIVHRLGEEINTYYELTYSPTIDAYDGHFRRIAVKVARPDVRVQSRSGYFALPYIPGQQVFSYEVPMLSALTAKPVPKGVEFRAAVQFFPSTTAVVFDVPLKDVTIVKDSAAKTFRCNLAILGLFKDSQGEIVKKVSRDVPVSNSFSNLEATLAGHFIYTQQVSLAPGKYTFEAAVLDRESDKLLTGVKKQSLVVPASVPIALTLVRKVTPPRLPPDAEDPFEFPGGRVTPELKEAISGGKGATLDLYLVAQIPGGMAGGLAIDFMQDGKLIARSEPKLPAADASGRVAYVTTLPVDSLKPGPYEVWARLSQGAFAAQERIFIDIIK